jgi:DNA modification methylase
MKKIPQLYKNPTDKRIAQRIAKGKMCRGYDWWEINQVKNVSKKDNCHSCPIPEEVARRIILSTTQVGDLIVDPFCGSGTILKVASELNRNYMGFELSKLYCETARSRIRPTIEQQKLNTKTETAIPPLTKVKGILAEQL